MLFSFFNKHEKQATIREHLGGFQDNFTENQKKAIMCSLLLVANSDRELHPKELQFFEKTAMILGYRLTGNYLADFLAMSRDELFKTLNSLDDSQKDWYIVTAMGMMHSDGQTLDVEIKYLEVFFDKIGLTYQRIEDVVKKSQLIMKMFEK